MESRPLYRKRKITFKNSSWCKIRDKGFPGEECFRGKPIYVCVRQTTDLIKEPIIPTITYSGVLPREYRGLFWRSEMSVCLDGIAQCGVALRFTFLCSWILSIICGRFDVIEILNNFNLIIIFSHHNEYLPTIIALLLP